MTFWTAAQSIITQCYESLKPGGIAVWVVKDFFRRKKRYPFAQGWRQLCETAGFSTLEVIRAWLVSPGPTQQAFIGADVDFTKARKTFFRRMYEKRYPHLSIDWEEVLICRRPLYGD